MPYRPPQHIADALLLERPRIIQLIHDLVDQTFQAAHYGTNGTAGEVERLVYFFVEGLPDLESALGNVLRPYRLRLTISGVFCHQTPRVLPLPRRADLHGCELADLAFIVTYGQPLSRDGTGIGNALLLQAKNDFHPGANNSQEYLYEQADGLEYSSPSSLRGQTRQLLSAANCLWYWDFQAADPRRSYCWNTVGVLARPHLLPQYYHDRFERVLCDLFCGATGRGFQCIDASSTSQAWSRVIHDIVSVPAAAFFNRRNVFITHNGPRPRGFNIVPALHAGFPPRLVRCSLDTFLANFGQEASTTGEKLEYLASTYRWEKDHDLHHGPPRQMPPLERGEGDDDGTRGNYIVFAFDRLE